MAHHSYHVSQMWRIFKKTLKFIGGFHRPPRILAGELREKNNPTQFYEEFKKFPSEAKHKVVISLSFSAGDNNLPRNFEKRSPQGPRSSSQTQRDERANIQSSVSLLICLAFSEAKYVFTSQMTSTLSKFLTQPFLKLYTSQIQRRKQSWTVVRTPRKLQFSRKHRRVTPL